MPYTSNIYQLRQFTQHYSHTHPHLVLRLSIHLSNCSLTTLHIPQKLQSLPVSTFTSTGCSESVMSTLCGPMDCSPLGSSVHGIFPARILEWVTIFYSRGSSQPGIKPVSPALQVDSLSSEAPGKPQMHKYYNKYGTLP